MNVQAALTAATSRLTQAGIDRAAGDARRLMAHVLGIDPAMLIARIDTPLSDADRAGFDHAIARRAKREPVSHIIGRRDFYAHEFAVTADVLDPRPETETLVELALAAPFRHVLDLGTGSGVILLSLLAARPDSTGVGVDISPAALEVARINADALGVGGRVSLLQGSWFAPVTGRFDLVVANPPYISADEYRDLAPELRLWEPQQALVAEEGGLAAYRAILPDLASFLAPGGRALLEIGATQGAAVMALAREAGFDAPSVHPDLDGRDRVLSVAIR